MCVFSSLEVGQVVQKLVLVGSSHLCPTWTTSKGGTGPEIPRRVQDKHRLRPSPHAGARSASARSGTPPRGVQASRRAALRPHGREPRHEASRRHAGPLCVRTVGNPATRRPGVTPGRSASARSGTPPRGVQENLSRGRRGLSQRENPASASCPRAIQSIEPAKAASTAVKCLHFVSKAKHSKYCLQGSLLCAMLPLYRPGHRRQIGDGRPHLQVRRPSGELRA